MDRVESNLERLTAITLVLPESQKAFQDEMRAFQEQQRAAVEYLDDALGRLIKMTDEWIRRNPNT